MPKLTEEQALAGLIDFWRALVGPSEDTQEIRADDNFIDVFQRDWDGDLDVSIIPSRLRADLGVDASDDAFFKLMSGTYEWASGEDWEREVKPTLTFRRVAQWIVDHTEAPSFAPVNVAGRTCGPAGAFFGIADTIETLSPGNRFPPRTPILSRLDGRELDRVWTRLRLYTGAKLPGLVFPYRELGDAILLAAILLGFIAMMILGLTGQFLWLARAVLVCGSVGVWGINLRHRGNPLPPGIQTFRDLAYAMSAIMNGPEPAPVRNSAAK